MKEAVADLMPTERKSMWRTAEERRMSDLTRVLEWMERRWGKKKRALQHMNTKEKRVKKSMEHHQEKSNMHYGFPRKKKRKKGTRRLFKEIIAESVTNLERDMSAHIHEAQRFPNRLNKNIYTMSLSKESFENLDIKDAIALESAPRPMAFRRQSMAIDPMVQDSMFGNRRVTLMRDWASKTPDSTYERKLKSLMEKNTEPKMENVKMLKPEEIPEAVQKQHSYPAEAVQRRGAGRGHPPPHGGENSPLRTALHHLLWGPSATRGRPIAHCNWPSRQCIS
uniref:Uncharacterized protein n=1 Tax=Castor canadensis TaxID=51338 RepID=A0A8C0XM27_CASCN